MNPKISYTFIRAKMSHGKKRQQLEVDLSSKAEQSVKTVEYTEQSSITVKNWEEHKSDYIESYKYRIWHYQQKKGTST